MPAASRRSERPASGPQAVVLGAVMAVGVAVTQRGLTWLVEASGAREAPALILVILLAAFLGALTAVATRIVRIPSAIAPVVLVLGWIVVPWLLAAIPSEAAALLAGDAALTAPEALALAAATVAAAVTLGVPAERR